MNDNEADAEARAAVQRSLDWQDGSAPEPVTEASFRR